MIEPCYPNRPTSLWLRCGANIRWSCHEVVQRQRVLRTLHGLEHGSGREAGREEGPVVTRPRLPSSARAKICPLPHTSVSTALHISGSHSRVTQPCHTAESHSRATQPVLQSFRVRALTRPDRTCSAVRHGSPPAPTSRRAARSERRLSLPFLGISLPSSSPFVDLSLALPLALSLPFVGLPLPSFTAVNHLPSLAQWCWLKSHQADGGFTPRAQPCFVSAQVENRPWCCPWSLAVPPSRAWLCGVTFYGRPCFKSERF